MLIRDSTRGSCVTCTGSGYLILVARAQQAIKFPILTIYVMYTIENAWREPVAITAPVRTRAALEMPSLWSKRFASRWLVLIGGSELAEVARSGAGR